MAIPANTQTTYTTIGQREDLSDVIYNVAPFETPFLSGMPKTKATGKTHEWQTDSLAPASTANWVIEGDDATTDASVATTRLSNFCGISDKVARVTGSVEAVAKAGRSKEMAYQLIKRGRELRNDIEAALFNNNPKVSGSATVARQVAGIEAFCVTNTSAGTGGADPVGDGSNARTDGTQRAFTEDLLLGVHQSCWTNGGKPGTLYVGAFNKRVASGFTGVATKTKDVNDKRIVASADVYVSDFGTIKIVPSRHCRGRTGYLLQEDMWAFATLRAMSTQKLAKTGDSDREQIICEWTLEARNEVSSGIIADLTTA